MIQNAPSSSPTPAGWLFQPHEVEPQLDRPGGTIQDSGYDGVRVEAFVFLGRRSSEATSALLVPHNPALAALALLPYCTLLPRREDADELTSLSAANDVVDWGVGLPRIAPVTARVPVYDLGRGPLPEMVAAVESLAAGTSPGKALKGHS